MKEKKKIENLKISLKRNEKKDRWAAEKIGKKLKEAEENLIRLENEEKNFQSEQKTRKDQKKLSIF